MSSSERRKIDCEKRLLSNEWCKKYFVIQHNKNVICLICQNTTAVMKKYNIKRHYCINILPNLTAFFVFSFRPFPLVRGGHSVSSFSTSFCLQHPSPSHQLHAYLPLLHLKIFSLVSLFSSFLVTPFPSFFFLHTLGLSS